MLCRKKAIFLAVLSLSLVNSEAEAGFGSFFRKLTVGVILGAATGGIGAALGATATQAATAAVTTAVATAAGANVRTGVNMNGNGEMTGVHVDVTDNHGRRFANIDTEQQHIRTPEEVFRERLQRAQGEAERRRLEKESEEAKGSFSNWKKDTVYAVLHNGEKVYHVASSKGDTFMTTTDRGGWSKTSRALIGTMTFANQPKNLTFEKTCYEWHFGIEEIDGLRYNHAWTLTGLDFMVPEGEYHTICAPSWYVNKEKMAEEARMKAAIQDAALKTKQDKSERERLEQAMRDAARASAEGYLRETMYGTLYAQREISRNRNGKDFAGVAMQYYDKAVETLRPFGCFLDRVFEEMATPGGVENLRRFQNGEISAHDFDLTVSADLATDAAASGIGAWIGGAAGGAGMAYATAGGGTAAGVSGGSAAGATLAYLSSRSLKAVARTSVSWFKGNLNSSDKERKQAVKEDTKRYSDGLKDKGVLSESGKTSDGHLYYRIEEKCEYLGV